MNNMTSYFKIEEKKSQIISYTTARLINVLDPENPPAQSRIDYVVTCIPPYRRRPTPRRSRRSPLSHLQIPLHMSFLEFHSLIVLYY